MNHEIKRKQTRYISTTNTEALGVLNITLLFIVCSTAWVTHVLVCLSKEAWGFLITGAIMFPIAIIHGVGIWFEFF